MKRLVPILLAAGACSQVLGLETAELDETFVPDAGAGTSAGGAGASDGGNAGAPGGTGGSAGETPDPGAGGSGGDAGASGSAGAAGGPPVPATPCERYCDALMRNCTGTDAQYTDIDTCLAVCATLPLGNEGDSKKNTVYCRLRQATLAVIEPFTHCTFAGPGGHGECGSNCDGFCSTVMSACTSAFGPHYYATTADCVSECTALEDLGSFTTSPQAKHFEGAHVQCRLYHVSAATQDAEYHCEHAVGGDPCTAPTGAN